MTKADLIEEVSKLSSLTKKETELIVNTVFDNITDALAKGDKVELRGFGSFRIRHRPGRPQSQDGRQRRSPSSAPFFRSALPSSSTPRGRPVAAWIDSGRRGGCRT
jgi:integration host factor subunit beta